MRKSKKFEKKNVLFFSLQKLLSTRSAVEMGLPARAKKTFFFRFSRRFLLIEKRTT